jgi:hypothetical protein
MAQKSFGNSSLIISMGAIEKRAQLSVGIPAGKEEEGYMKNTRPRTQLDPFDQTLESWHQLHKEKEMKRLFPTLFLGLVVALVVASGVASAAPPNDFTTGAGKVVTTRGSATTEGPARTPTGHLLKVLV